MAWMVLYEAIGMAWMVLYGAIGMAWMVLYGALVRQLGGCGKDGGRDYTEPVHS